MNVQKRFHDSDPLDLRADFLSAPDVGFRYSPLVIPGVAFALDLALIAVASLVAVLATVGFGHLIVDYYLVATCFVAVLYCILGRMSLIYGISAVMRPVRRTDDVLVILFTATMFLVSFITPLGVLDVYDGRWLAAFPVLAAAAIITGRIALKALLIHMARRRLIGWNLVVLGVGEQSRRLLSRLRSVDPYFYAVVGVYGDVPPGAPECFEGVPVRGGLADLIRHAREGRIDSVVIAMPWQADEAVTSAVEALKELPIHVHLSTDLVGFELAFRPVMGDFAQLPIFEVVQRPISGWNAALKTLEDYVLGGLAVIALSPLLLMIAIAIKLDSPGPVLFRQKRLGFNNKEFSIFKFRSMRHLEGGERVVRQATRGDPRITRVGAVIRSTSLDELPQLFNVLNGTMSLVGPRPHAVSHNEEYGRQIRGYFARHRVKPGITGWAQVNGLRGETNTIDKMEARIRHDIYYADNWSLLFDLRILVQTAFVFLFQKTAV